MENIEEYRKIRNTVKDMENIEEYRKIRNTVNSCQWSNVCVV